ncbi:MAG: 4'-phosphopantetheinyl transferase superfamily protein [Spirochaetales bacterium]|nr:4'-phosphopantetheinyl transferase superfamily protein [Spirochaetales bacterium]
MKIPADFPLPPLRGKDIHLWSFPVSPYETHARENLHVLSQRERDKADRFYRERDRIGSRVVYVLLREILSLYTGKSPGSIEILLGEKGKPYIYDRKAPFFNLSHSGNRVLFGFSPKGEVGVDIEIIKENRDLDGLIGASCSPGEIKSLDGLPADERTALFYQYWSLKEAYLKGVSMGITVPLKEVDFSRGERIGSWSAISCSRWDGFSAAAALKAENPRLVFITGE